MVRSKKSIKKIKKDISTITINEVGVIYEDLYFDWAEIEVTGYNVVGGLMLKTIKQSSYILPICHLNEKELDKLNEILLKHDLIKNRIVKKHIS